MTATERLCLIGMALYGDRWQSSVARLLGVSERTVRRWVAGAEPPAGIWPELQSLMRERMNTLRELLLP